MDKKYDTIAIDFLNVFKACHATGKHLQTTRGIGTGALASLLPKLRKLMVEHRPKEILILMDSPNSWRRDAYSAYKGTRVRAKDEMERGNELQQLEDCKAMLRFLPNVVMVEVDGYEADDLAGLLYRNFSEQPDMKLLLVSNDKDWLQLVGPNVDVLRFSSKKTVNLKNFSEHAEGCDNPEQFLEVKAIVGDPGDNVPGAKGVGVATALKYLRGRLNKKAVGRRRIEDWKEDPAGYQRSLMLMDLRTRCRLDTLELNVHSHSDLHRFLARAEELELNTILKKSDWLDAFGT